MVAVGGLNAVAALLATAEAILLHEPCDAIATVVTSVLEQFHPDTGAAVGLPALGVYLVDFLGQSLVLRRTWARTGLSILPVVVAAGGDFQIVAKRQD